MPDTPTPAPATRAPGDAPDDAPDDAGELAAFVHGPLDAALRTRLDAAVPPGAHVLPSGLTARRRQALTYRRMAAAGRAAPPAAGLLDDPAALCGLLERAAIADPALFHVLLLHYTLALAPILRFAPAGPDVPQALAAARARLESFEDCGTLLMTEVGRSNSHLSPRTTARYDPATREFVLTSPDARAAKFPTNTAHPGVAKTAAVYATLVHGGAEHGVFVFVVPLRAADGTVPAGVRIIDAPDSSGLNVDYAAVRLDGLRVPFGAWLSDGASLSADGAFHDPLGGAAARLTRSMAIGPAVWRAAVSACAAVTRASAGLLAAHSAGRVTLGRLAPQRPLTDYRNQGEAVWSALASAYALTAVAAHAKSRRTTAEGPAQPAPPDGGGDGGAAWAPWSAVDRDLPLLKTAATVRAETAVDRCRLHSGAPGFTATDRLNAYRGLAHAYRSAGGDNDLILFDTARAMAAGDRYTPPDPGPAGGDVRDPATWLHLAARAERALAERLTARTAAAARAGADPFTAWNGELALATRAATAHADRAVLRIAADAAETGPPRLRPLMRLFALDWIEDRAGVLLNEGAAGPGLLDRVWEARRAVTDALTPADADALTAALDLPAALTAPADFITGAGE
ncbi:acyl-CoA dehydrogenase [Actinomadura atramentaria]|uniref:acyl-CoA dehydrogenase n=1 Tax=Actinomadura atramentaria TaxID=1990 RepID=UPI000368D7A9|nr:acyl-CoA dehydrogenase [Actinomadura atramentaria]